MRYTVPRQALAALLAAVAVFHLAEGALVLAGVCSPPADYAATAFGGPIIPMLLAAIVVGGSALLAATAVLMRHPWGLVVAVVAGLALIAWEIADVVVARTFSAVFVAVGVAVIALAEYLGANEVAPKPHTRTRVALLVLEWFVATGAIDGGLALLRGAFDQYVSVAWLAGTPFRDYGMPALVLVIVVGGSALVAAASVFVYREWAVLASALAGVILAGFLVVEAASIDGQVGDVLPTVLGMQLLYFVPALTITWLARSLWLAEYRPRHAPSESTWCPAAPAAAARP
jgi:hypothetical protein